MTSLHSLTRRPAVLAGGVAAVAAVAAGLAWLPAAHSRWWLPAGVALAIGAHVFCARGVKAVLSAAAPLASGAPEAVNYQRSVYGTPGRQTHDVVAVVLLAGALVGFGVTLGSGWTVLGGVVALLAAVGLDVQRWERVAASADWVWFQRGYGQKVHQVPIDNIRDIAIHEEDVPGFSLRHGSRNRVCRLNLRMADKRIVALPKTDALVDLDDVEAVANHIRSRRQLMDDLASRRAPHAADKPVAAPPRATPATADEQAMRDALKALRRAANKDGVPTLQSELRPPPRVD